MLKTDLQSQLESIFDDIYNRDRNEEVFDDISKLNFIRLFDDMKFIDKYLRSPKIRKIYLLNFIVTLKYLTENLQKYIIDKEIKKFILKHQIKYVTEFLPRLKKYLPNLSIDNLIDNSKLTSIYISNYMDSSNKIKLIGPCSEEDEMEKSQEILGILDGRTVDIMSLIYGGKYDNYKKYKKYKIKYLKLKNNFDF